MIYEVGAKNEKRGIFLAIPKRSVITNKVGITNIGIFFFILFSNAKR